MSGQAPWVDVAVVGGGIAGLVAAWELGRAGRSVVVLEAAASPGGAVARHRVGGLELDAGAESFATSTSNVENLISDLGLTDRTVLPNPAGAWVQYGHGAAPLPKGGLLGIPPRPWARDVIRVVGVTGSARASADRLLPRTVGADRRTLGGLVRSRMGSRVLRRLVEPVAGGVYSADPDVLELASVNPRLTGAIAVRGSLGGAVETLRASAARPGSAAAGLRGGMFTLVEALTSAIEAGGGQIRTSCPVSGVAEDADGWTLRTDNGPLRAGLVVLASTGPAVVNLLERLLSRARDGWEAPTGEVALVTLVVDSTAMPDPGALARAPRGTGILVASGATGITAKALTHATAKWSWLAEVAGPDRHVLRLSYGRAAGDLPPDDRLPSIALRDAARLLAVDLPERAVAGTAVVHWSSTQPRPATGHAAAVSRLRDSLPPGLILVGSQVAGTGLAAVVRDTRSVVASLVGSNGANG